MPEALAASSDHDFTVSSPRPPRRPRAKAARAEPVREGLAKRGIAFAGRYPLEILISLALAAAGGAITWNALVLQTTHHPAPLFGRAAKGEGPAPLPPARPSLAVPAAPAPVVPAPLPAVAPAPTLPPAPATPAPARPAARDSIGDLIRTGEAPAAAPAPRPAPPARPAPVAAPPRDITSSVAAPAPARGGIGDLIRLGDPAPIPPGFVGKPEVNRVAAAQRALSKLGYGAMKVDGMMGSGTRQAIERFERDRRLPVTGELGPRTARELASVSGLPVD